MKKLIAFMAVILALLLLACSDANGGDADFTDSLGREVSVASCSRVAVLSGSLCDAWLLAGGNVTAVTSDAPELPITLPEDVIMLGSMKTPNIELLADSEIDFAIMSGNLSGQTSLDGALTSLGIAHAYFNVETFADYAAMMKIFTDITGRADLYAKYVADIGDDIAAQLARSDGSKPTVLFLRAFSGGVKAKGSEDSMTGAMLKELDCVNVCDGGITGDISTEAIVTLDPDFIFVTFMGEEAEARETLEALITSNRAWEGLTAVKEGRFHTLPKELFQNKPNARWAESYRILADYLYGKD